MSFKITKLEDITDDLLKQSTASEVTEWVKTQLKAADDSYQTEKNKLENEIKASKEASEKLTADTNKLQEDLKKVNEALAALQAEKEARAKQDAFNSRMAALDKDFNLADAEREIIASDIANLNDESFDSYRKKLDVLLAAKKKGNQSEQAQEKSGNKADIQTQKSDMQKGADDQEEKAKSKIKAKEAKASTEGAKETIEAALENADNSPEKLAAATTAGDPSFADRCAKAFAVDQWISDIKLTE